MGTGVSAAVAPGCEHLVHYEYDIERCGWWARHGDNPEARMFISDYDLVSSTHAKAGERSVRRWLHRIHAREEQLAHD